MEAFMSVELSKEAKQQIEQQIKKESWKIALKVGGSVAGLLSFVFFFIGIPEIAMMEGKIFALIVISFLAAQFAYVTYANRQLKKCGLPLWYVPTPPDKSPYDTYFDANPTRINPATGLPTIGGIDVGGNPYGMKKDY
jgi:hypothetical protein